MPQSVIKKLIAALADSKSDIKELEETLNEYNIPLVDENGDFRSTLEIIKDISEYAESKDSRFIPKKPLPENKYYGNGICPNCGVYFLDKSTKYCGNCGQALDWSE